MANFGYTGSLKTVIDGLITGAKQRANHTGTQSADTLTDGVTVKAYTTAERAKLDGVAAGATVNRADAATDVLLAGKETAGAAAAAQAAAVQRGNHTGTQTAASISDFTEAVQDTVAALLGAGSNVTLTYNDTAGTLTVAATASGGTGLDAEAVRDAIGVALIGVGPVAVTVNDAADTITISTTATVNATDAQLRDRATHTGTQPASTVTGLAAVATTGAKADVGLGNVDNTSDAQKPVSTAQQTALDAKVPATRTVAGKALTADVTLAKADVGLANVDNTADSSKPVSTLQAAALAGKKTAMAQQPTQTASFAAAAGNLYPVNAAAGNVTVTLPTSTLGQEVQVKKLDANAATGATSGIVNVTGTINGVPGATVPIRKQGMGKQYLADGSGGWTIVLGDLDITKLDASATEPGFVALAGDLAGTAAAPTVPALAQKAPLASPAFTGTPTIGGAAAATKPQIDAAQAALTGINTQTASYTLAAADAGKQVEYDSATAGTFTVPPNATVPYPVGTVIALYLKGTGALTIAAGTGVTVRSPAGLRLTTQHASATLTKRAADEWVAAGYTVT